MTESQNRFLELLKIVPVSIVMMFWESRCVLAIVAGGLMGSIYGGAYLGQWVGGTLGALLSLTILVTGFVVTVVAGVWQIEREVWAEVGVQED